MDEGEIVMFLRRILKINPELHETYEQAIVLRPLPKYRCHSQCKDPQISNGLAKGRIRWRRVTLGFSWEGGREI
jgi:hypothetical protein